jgi:hypothetical protein
LPRTGRSITSTSGRRSGSGSSPMRSRWPTED